MKNQEYLRNEPFFWSRMGFNYDPPRYDKNHEQIVFSKEYDKYRKFHDDFTDAGIQYHTTILNSGWVDDKTYDYRLTDETLDGILKDNPNIYYMPRVKLNAPPSWCKNHPEEVFVYEKYKNLTLEEISDLCETLEQDYFGFNCPNGYAAASVSNIFFGNAVAGIGWGSLILVWAALMGIGVLAVISTKYGRKSG